MTEFSVSATWTGDLRGQGSLAASPGREWPIAVPQALGGTGDGTNPEELILGAAASCFLITFSAVASRQQLPVARAHVTTKGDVSTDGGLTLKSVTHHPHVELLPGATVEDRAKVDAALLRAEQFCLVSRAMKNNVAVTVQLGG